VCLHEVRRFFRLLRDEDLFILLVPVLGNVPSETIVTTTS